MYVCNKQQQRHIQSRQHSVAFNTNTKHFLSIINESAFGFVNPAVIMALSAFAAECRAAGETGTTRSTALSSKPAACRCCDRMTGQTNGRTDGRTHDRYRDPALHTMRVVPTTIGYNQLHIQSTTVIAAITY